ERMSNEEVLARVIYRDALMLVFDKPAGIPVHPANGSRHNLKQYFHLLQFGLPKPPALAHRLDLGTSGCLLLARHAHAARRLHALFSSSAIKKTYTAMVHGSVATDVGRIDIPLSKQSPQKKHWWMKADPEGNLAAITDYQVIFRSESFSWLKLAPITGRTHQLRVHCAAIGHPIVGDYIYGTVDESERTLHLHAQEIVVPLYPNKPAIAIEAKLPPHMAKSLDSLFDKLQQ
ncbi:MAG TPA: RNA pseudouridine synthase, partial [Myxococcota bacterium]|nr:RNA pseudouridine synthase [Myxococcota bacterium]